MCNYIAIEGIKGCGKSTLIERLVNSGVTNFSVFAPFSQKNMSDQNRQLLLQTRGNNELEKVYEYVYTETAQSAAQCFDWSTPAAIGDRSILTSYATRLHQYPTQEECINNIDLAYTTFPVPSAIIYLKTDPRVALMRIEKRSREYGKMHETYGSLRRQSQNYDQLITVGIPPRLKDTRFYVLDGNASIQCLTRQAIAIIMFELLFKTSIKNENYVYHQARG